MPQPLQLSPAVAEALQAFAQKRHVDVGEALGLVLELGLEAADRQETADAGVAAGDAAVRRLEDIVLGRLGPALFAANRMLAALAVRNAAPGADVDADEYLESALTIGRLECEAALMDGIAAKS